MKFSFPSLCVLFIAAAGLARAQDDQQMPANPDEIITDFGIEEYLAVPKFTLSIGARTLSGAKTSFTGRGYISSYHPSDDITSTNVSRVYHDGNAIVDTEPFTFTITHADGTTTTYTSPQTPPGFTNTWSILDLNQERSDGNIDFHSYSADAVDSGLHQNSVGSTAGVEVVVARDMGKIGNRLEWKLLFGASLSDIKSHTSQNVDATITTITDTYATNLNGNASLPGAVPYTAPHWVQVPQVDATGLPVYDSTGAQIIDYVEQTVLLGDHPILRTTTVAPGTVFNQWDMRGAYFTFRLGPSISYLITDRLKFTVSAGASLIYAGTTYTVSQTYQPDTADPLVSTATDDEAKFLPGYYVDASLQFDINEKTGVYAGVVYQDNGSYTQTAVLDDTAAGGTGSHSSYKSLIDLSSLSGFRMGMSFKF